MINQKGTMRIDRYRKSKKCYKVRDTKYREFKTFTNKTKAFEYCKGLGHECSVMKLIHGTHNWDFEWFFDKNGKIWWTRNSDLYSILVDLDVIKETLIRKHGIVDNYSYKGFYLNEPFIYSKDNQVKMC